MTIDLNDKRTIRKVGAKFHLNSVLSLFFFNTTFAKSCAQTNFSWMGTFFLSKVSKVVPKLYYLKDAIGVAFGYHFVIPAFGQGGGRVGG